MSASKSNLSSESYGYDFVVATTQESINATMLEYLSGISSPTIEQYYLLGDKGENEPISKEDLLKITNGIDPFDIPADTLLTDKRLVGLFNANFAGGFKAKIGLPLGYFPHVKDGPTLPPIVDLSEGIATVGFTLMCSEFQIISMSGRRTLTSWINKSQQPGKAWLVSTKSDLKHEEETDHDKLPKSVKDAIKGLSQFSIQQLFLDLDNAAIETLPIITGTSNSAINKLLSSFFQTYFLTLQKQGKPVFNYSVTQPASTTKTSLPLVTVNREISKFVSVSGKPIQSPTSEQKNLATLCYLGMSTNDAMPPTVPFNWNWIDSTESTSYNGVVAIKKSVLVNYLKEKLMPIVKGCCFKAYTDVYVDLGADEGFTYKYSLTKGQTPDKITLPSTGSTVITMEYSSSDYSKATFLDTHNMTLQSSNNVSVEFKNDTIIITQHLIVYTKVVFLTAKPEGNIVDKKITDTYSLATDGSGALLAKMTSTTEDNSVSLKKGFWGGLESPGLLGEITNTQNSIARDILSSDFKDIPIDTLRGFMFPGGKTFSHSNVAFSEHQDLISHITYNDPS